MTASFPLHLVPQNETSMNTSVNQLQSGKSELLTWQMIFSYFICWHLFFSLFTKFSYAGIQIILESMLLYLLFNL